MIRRPPRSTLFPSTPLSRSATADGTQAGAQQAHDGARSALACTCNCACTAAEDAADRKSTRLNSSHLVISYAVFCLKKKKKTKYDRMAAHASTLTSLL